MTLAIVLAILGLALMIVEYFLATGGFLIVGGIVVCVIAVGVVAKNAEDIRETVAAVVILCVGAPIATIVGMNLLGKRYALVAESLATATNDSDAATGESLVGRYGRAVTPLRPAGAVEFDGRRVDAVTEGVFLDIGSWVKCIEERGIKIVVRAVPKPPDLGDLELNDLT